MIRSALVCERKHTFESWFPNSSAYDKQVKRGLLSCPICGSEEIEKAIMAPQIARKDRGAERDLAPVESPEPAVPVAVEKPGQNQVAMMSPQEHEFRQKLKELREHVTKNADYVGPQFPEQARKMHYGELEHRSIYGEASAEEVKDLSEEGIEFHALPILPDDRN
jgi:hypothetical protein